MWGEVVQSVYTNHHIFFFSFFIFFLSPDTVYSSSTTLSNLSSMELFETQTFQTFDHPSNIPFPFPLNNVNGDAWDLPEIQNSESSTIVTPEQECRSPAVTADSNSHFEGEICISTAVVKLQKVYRSYRTRRMLADSAVVAEELWWLAIDFARLNHSTISFFDFSKPESAASRWNRVKLNASKVGKGLSKDAKAQKLAFQHWIEAIDPRHRYGHNLHLYYDEWCKSDAGQPFFYWLDIGDGKGIDLKECPRSKLKQQCIKYLGPQEREHYEYIIDGGKFVHLQSGGFLDTNEESGRKKWIFVMSTSKKLYAGQKQKGRFHHSSFLAGGSTLAAGRLEVEDGFLKSISPYSGHYRPTEERLHSFLSFLKENGVNLDQVDVHKSNEEYEYEEGKLSKEEVAVPLSVSTTASETEENIEVSELNITVPQAATRMNSYKRTFSGGLESPRADVPRKAILERMNSKKVAKSYQLGHQLSMKWSTGTGPRIGCIADYPMELRVQAMELTNLSPKIPHMPLAFNLLSPTAANGNEVSRE